MTLVLKIKTSVNSFIHEESAAESTVFKITSTDCCDEIANCANSVVCSRTSSVVQFAGIPSCDSSRSCHISYAYVDGSAIAGVLSTETMAVSNSLTGVLRESDSFLFGCMNNDTGSFAMVDGLAGFGRGPNSLPSQLTQSTAGNVFSYCLVPYTASTVLTSSMLFGVSGLAMVHTPVLTYNEYSYWVNMTGISVDGSELGIPSTAICFNLAVLKTSNNGLPSGLHLLQLIEFVIF